MAVLLCKPSPVVRRGTAFHDQIRWWCMDQQALKLRAAQALPFQDVIVFVCNGDLKHGFCEVNADGCRLHAWTP
jgi:hypothetical protein